MFSANLSERKIKLHFNLKSRCVCVLWYSFCEIKYSTVDFFNFSRFFYYYIVFLCSFDEWKIFKNECVREGVSDSVHSYSQIRGGVSLDKVLSFAGALPRASVAKTFQIWQEQRQQWFITGLSASFCLQVSVSGPKPENEKTLVFFVMWRIN